MIEGIEMRIDERIVGDEGQERFAAATGDRNPIHMDAVQARRTQAGLPVVHGMHTLLWALETLTTEDHIVRCPTRIKVKFLKWVYLGDMAEIILVSSVESILRFRVEVAGMSTLSAEIHFGASSADQQIELEDIHSRSAQTPLEAPRNLDLAELEKISGNAFVATKQDMRQMFPDLCDLVEARTVAELAACSYVVGMEAPGLYSTFSKLDLEIGLTPTGGAGESLSFNVARVDERFRKAQIHVIGSNIDGFLDTFVRTPPVEQATMPELASRVRPEEFADMRALIIGGSRGLGELTAKLIGAGGGSSTITYTLGKLEAGKVIDQIRSAGKQIEMLPYDVRKPAASQLSLLNGPITHLFYFATNAIFRPKGEVMSSSILADFSVFYIQGFYDLCKELVGSEKTYVSAKAPLAVYYPSSIAVEERPAGMTEYSMIKAAGEILCDDMNQHMPGLHIITTRLPRLRTDQTAGVLPEREQDPVDILLPILRKLSSSAGVKA
ncbi:MaoC domain protein dehydratase [Granulicella tundricola MP5ACTX9]|uniref:MaoC domain protein dehydratase n=2 Tax=Granulicella TaxID=940557 RepID=E8X530_GRATM|nr:MaoC domain protein dehydratase [Granulicella tundricola MP5ACTX9]